MKKPKFSAFSHTLEDVAGRMVLSYRTRCGQGSVVLAAGTSDHVTVLRIKDTVYILAVNKKLPYVGLEMMELQNDPDYDELGDGVFLQGSEKCEECLGKDWEDREDWELTGILEEYL